MENGGPRGRGRFTSAFELKVVLSNSYEWAVTSPILWLAFARMPAALGLGCLTATAEFPQQSV